MADPMHFEAKAAIYTEARPPYPVELWSALQSMGYLVPGRRVLELGAGTGQATGPLLGAGLRVTAVEPGDHLAARLRADHPSATVRVERAEDLRLGRGAFELAVAATSIHWMDLDAVLPIVHRALTPDGALLVWRNVFGDSEVAESPFRERVSRIISARAVPARVSEAAPARGSTRESASEDVGVTADALTRGGLFSVREIRTFRWQVALDDQQILRLFTTFSDWTTEEAEQAASAVRSLGGRVVEDYRTWLIALDRVDV